MSKKQLVEDFANEILHDERAVEFFRGEAIRKMDGWYPYNDRPEPDTSEQFDEFQDHMAAAMRLLAEDLADHFSRLTRDDMREFL